LGWRAGADLFVEHLLDVPDLLLGFAFGLIRFAFGLKPFVSNDFSRGLLGLAADILAGTFCFVLIAGFHFLYTGGFTPVPVFFAGCVPRPLRKRYPGSGGGGYGLRKAR